MMPGITRESRGKMAAGQDLVVAGYAGLAGTVLLIKKKRQELEQWFMPAYLAEAVRCYNDERPVDPSTGRIPGVTEWEASGEGGILKTIWDLTGAYKVGVRFFQRKIPVRQETIEICERLELNPYRLFSENCFLLISQNGGQTVEYLKEQNTVAGVIGMVTPGRAIEMPGSKTTGYLERPRPDEIYKII